MAKKVRKKTTKQQKQVAAVSPFKIYWEKTNYILLAVGFILIIVGFYVMSLGEWDSFTSLVISPILLFLGYIFVFPASIFYRKKKEVVNTEETELDVSKS